MLCRLGKWVVLVAAIFSIIPISLALESDIYFVTSEVTIGQVVEEVEIVGKTEQLELIELKLPLSVSDPNVIFNAVELDCSLKEEFGYKNSIAVPKIEKVVVNVGVGRIQDDQKARENIGHDLMMITGQKPNFRAAKNTPALY